MPEIKSHADELARVRAGTAPTLDQRMAALENAQTRTMLAVETLARKDSAGNEKLGSEKLGSERLDDDRSRKDDDARLMKLVHDAVRQAFKHHARKYDAKEEDEEGEEGEEKEKERKDFLNLSIPIAPEGGAGAEADEDKSGEPEGMASDDRRGDSVHSRIARLERNMRPRVLDADYLNELSECQAEWDKVAQMHGLRASRPLDGERVATYDRRMATVFKKFSDKWKNEDLKELPPTVMRNVAGPTIRADAIAAAYRPDPSPGALQREVRRQDQAGRWISEFVGPVNAVNGALAPFRMPPYRARFNSRPDDPSTWR